MFFIESWRNPEKNIKICYRCQNRSCKNFSHGIEVEVVKEENVCGTISNRMLRKFNLWNLLWLSKKEQCKFFELLANKTKKPNDENIKPCYTIDLLEMKWDE